MKTMNVKTLLLSVTVILGIMAIALAAHLAWSMLEQNNVARSGQQTNAIGDRLLESAGAWAIERGVTVTALNDSEAIGPDQRGIIERQRESGDSAFREAVDMIEKAGHDVDDLGLGEALDRFRDLETLRGVVDDELQQRGFQRRNGISGEWVAGITGLIEATQQLRRTLDFKLDTNEVRLGHYQQMKDSIWVMSEFAGRERAAVGAMVAEGAALDETRLEELAENRGRVEMAWEIVQAIADKPGTSQGIQDAVDEVRSTFFGGFENTRREIFEAGAAGEPYPIAATEWITRATDAINTILALSEEAGSEIERLNAEAARQGFTQFVAGVAFLVVALIAVAGALWIILGRVVRPLEGIRGAMASLANGEKHVDVPGLGRTDEIGAMADAVEVFRRNAIEMERLEAEQAEQEKRAEEEKRRALNELADSFLASVGGVVNRVSAAADQMKSTAQSMSGIAEETNHQATTVSAASDQASSNVRSVASAAEELSSSISEISRQVQEAARISNEAAASAESSNRTVEGLAQAVQEIGKVVELINEIAEQTNLLALNATIEAARAGEAGKGFAVVAAEVKELASQTAKATGDIGDQITSIQNSTTEAVNAMREVGGTIGTVNEISSSIASAVEQQGAATEEIARNVQQASAGTEQVNTNIVGVTQAASDAGSSATQVLSSAEELASQAEQLRAEVDRFVEQVRAA